MSKRFLIALGVAALALVAAFYFFKKDFITQDTEQDQDQDQDQDLDQDLDQDPGKVAEADNTKPGTDEPGAEKTS